MPSGNPFKDKVRPMGDGGRPENKFGDKVDKKDAPGAGDAKGPGQNPFSAENVLADRMIEQMVKADNGGRMDAAKFKEYKAEYAKAGGSKAVMLEYSAYVETGRIATAIDPAKMAGVSVPRALIDENKKTNDFTKAAMGEVKAKMDADFIKTDNGKQLASLMILQKAIDKKKGTTTYEDTLTEIKNAGNDRAKLNEILEKMKSTVDLKDAKGVELSMGGAMPDVRGMLAGVTGGITPDTTGAGNSKMDPSLAAINAKLQV